MPFLRALLALGVLRSAGLDLGNHPREQFVERRLKLPAAGRHVLLFGVPRRGHARRLLDHDDVLVEIDDANVQFVGRRGERLRQQFHHVGKPQPAAGVDAEVAVDRHPPRFQQPAHLATTIARAATRAARPRRFRSTCRGRTRKSFSPESGLLLATFESLPDNLRRQTHKIPRRGMIRQWSGRRIRDAEWQMAVYGERIAGS